MFFHHILVRKLYGFTIFKRKISICNLTLSHDTIKGFRERVLMTSIIQIIFLLLDVLWYLIVIQVIMSWLVNFGILNMSQPLIIQVWTSINRLLEPVYRPVRNFLPATGGLDIAPLIVIIGIVIIRILIVNNFSAFV